MENEELSEIMFITEKQAACRFCQRSSGQEHGMLCYHKLTLKDDHRVGHVAHIHFSCCKDHHIIFHSSSRQGNQYTANLRMMMGYLCSGMLETHYEKMCSFSKIGTISQHKRSDLILTFSPVVQELAKESMSKAKN